MPSGREYDIRVRETTKTLFKKYMKTINSINAEIKELENSIRPVEDQIKSLKDLKNNLEVEVEKQIQIDNLNVWEAFQDEGADDVWVDLSNSKDRRTAIEDDGALIICLGQVCASFICNQEIRKSDWNKEAKPILEAFGFKWSGLNK